MEDNQTHAESTAPATNTQGSANTSGNSYAIPAAILFGFAMIAGAIYLGGDKAPVAVENTNAPAEAVEESVPVPEVNEDDHILGNPNAPIVIVEYSDFDCPFCKSFHETMNTVMETYGVEGKVAWVYRHFPIDRIHPSAPHIAAASECVAELGGNDAFWEFSDLVFGEREANQMTDTTRLTEFAETAGVDAAAYTECIESERTMELVQADLTDGINAGVRGTPFSFIMIAGQQLPINGAQPLEFVMANIDGLLEQLEQAEAAGGIEG